MKKRTADLEKGDVVVFGSERNRVESVELNKGGCSYRVHVLRTTAKTGFFGSAATWFDAGVNSVQEIEDNESDGTDS